MTRPCWGTQVTLSSEYSETDTLNSLQLEVPIHTRQIKHLTDLDPWNFYKYIGVGVGKGERMSFCPLLQNFYEPPTRFKEGSIGW